MIYGVLSILLFSGILLYLEYRIYKLENKVQDQKVIIDLLIYDFLNAIRRILRVLKLIRMR